MSRTSLKDRKRRHHNERNRRRQRYQLERRRRVQQILKALGLWDHFHQLGLEETFRRVSSTRLSVSVAAETPLTPKNEEITQTLQKAIDNCRFTIEPIGLKTSAHEFASLLGPILQYLLDGGSRHVSVGNLLAKAKTPVADTLDLAVDAS